MKGAAERPRGSADAKRTSGKCRNVLHCKDENDRDRDPAGKGAMDASLQVERMDDALGNQIIEKEKHSL